MIWKRNFNEVKKLRRVLSEIPFMKALYHCLLLIISLIFNSKEIFGQNNCGDTSVVSRLHGEWNWVWGFHSGIVIGTPSTPEKCHCNQKLNFKENCEVEIVFTKDDSLTSKTISSVIYDFELKRFAETSKTTSYLKIKNSVL
jgi:hypothetical protein